MHCNKMHLMFPSNAEKPLWLAGLAFFKNQGLGRVLFSVKNESWDCLSFFLCPIAKKKKKDFFFFAIMQEFLIREKKKHNMKTIKIH